MSWQPNLILKYAKVLPTHSLQTIKVQKTLQAPALTSANNQDRTQHLPSTQKKTKRSQIFAAS